MVDEKYCKVEKKFWYGGFRCVVLLIGLPVREVEIMKNFNKLEGSIIMKPKWRCGYVGVGKKHPFYKKDYSELDNTIFIHGGLTYSAMGDGKDFEKDVWWFGFDFNHSEDNKKKESLKSVIIEVKFLAKQLDKENLLMGELSK